MSYQLLGPIMTLVAASDLSSSQNCFCELTDTAAGSKVDLPSAGGSVVGVLVDKAISGQAAPFQVAGIAVVKLGGTVAPKDWVKADSSGRAVTASAQEVTDGKAVGRCVEGGTINQNGSILLLNGGYGSKAMTASESINSSVDSSVYISETLITLVTGDHTGVLADGLWVGQTKKLRVISADGTHKYTLTPTTMQSGQPTSFAFNSVGQTIVLTWSATGWVVTTVIPAGIETVSASGTFNLLCLVHLYAVADTVDVIIPNGWVGDHDAIVVASTNSGTPVGTTSGLFYTTAGAATGVDLNFNAASDMGVLKWVGARWFPVALVSATIS